MSGSEENGGGALATDSNLSTTSTVSTILCVPLVSTAINTDIVLQLDSFPDDVLFDIFKRLDIKNRLNCEKVNHRWNKLLKKWVDIESIAISEKHFSVKNECIESSVTFKVLNTARISSMVLTFLEKCTHVFLVVIHNAQILTCFSKTWSKFKNLQLLVLPNDTFDEYKDCAILHRLLANSKLQSLHILGRVKSFPSKKRVFAPLHISHMNQRLRVFHAHGIILGPLAMEKMAEKYHETLQELRIGAVCVNTLDEERYFKALSKFKNLKVLELPPSLFSISHPLNTQYLPVLTEMKKLECLSVFICPSGGSDASSFLKCLPKSVRNLMVRTYDDELPENIVANLVQQKIKLIFLQKKFYSFQWPFKRGDVNSQLFLKGFWEPPYFNETELIGVNLTPEIIREQTSNWTCNLPELSKYEMRSIIYEAVRTAQHIASDLDTTSPPPTIQTARERSPSVEHPSTGYVVQEVMNGMLDQVGVAPNEANGEAQSPLIRPASPPAAPPPAAQQLQPPQDGISGYALSTPTTTAISASSENVTTAIEELVLDATQQSDEFLLHSVASVSNVSTTSEQTSSHSTGSTETSSSGSESTSSGSGSSTTTSFASTASVGTGWYV